MAPINELDEIASTPWDLIATIVISSFAIISTVLLIVACACCKSKRENGWEEHGSMEPPHDGDDNCPDCLQYPNDGMQFNDQMDMEGSVDAQPRSYRQPRQSRSRHSRGRRHKDKDRRRSHHGRDHTRAPKVEDPEPDSKISIRPKQNGTGTLKSLKVPRKTPVVKFVSDSRRDNYKTLFGVETKVFGDSPYAAGQQKFGGKASPRAPTIAEPRVFVAEKNPAYKTLAFAKSGVFDKPRDGGGVGTVAVDRKNWKVAAVATVADPGMDEKMRAAAANPAHKTLFGAQTAVFNK